jgi:KDO2-lipid IV(A) lauroyltransferase
MSSDDQTSHPHLLREPSSNAEALARALRMVKVERPSWKALLAGRQERRRWLAYWLWERPVDGLQWLLFHVLGLLPITFVSNFGGRCSRIVVPLLHRDAIERTLANLRWLEPSWDEARLRRACMYHFETIGRLQAEFSILHRLMPSGRIAVENAELAKKTLAAGPTIVMGTHIGNWETVTPVMKAFGVPMCVVFEPQPSSMQTKLALQVRARCSAEGSVAFPRGANALRTAVRWLNDGKAFNLFCDEPVNGVSAAPFFGRRPHTRSNYAFAARLARMTGATVLPFHVIRHPGCRFTLRFGEPIVLPPARGRSPSLIDDVVRLNAAIEPVIRDNIENWYWLDWGFAGVRYR